MATKTIVTYIVSLLEDLHYHEMVTPEGGGEPIEGPAISWFDHVWAGQPKKIPDNNKRIAMVEIAEIPAFEYTTCVSHGKKEVDLNVTIGVKGEIERTTLAIYDLYDIVAAELNGASKLGGAVYASQVQSVLFGDIINGKNMLAACEIRVKVITGVT